MKRSRIYSNEWIKIHPYTSVNDSDIYFTDLANRLYSETVYLDFLPDSYKKSLCLYLCAYLEDIISDLGLWMGFRNENRRLYSKNVPFYDFKDEVYVDEEPNLSDICFIVWNTCQKALYKHDFVYPLDVNILKQSEVYYGIISDAYETAPENSLLTSLFDNVNSYDTVQANRILDWLFGHTYLTEPSMLPYISRVAPNDKFIMPTGPLALFLYEWIDAIVSRNNKGCDSEEKAKNLWQGIKGLYHTEQEIPETLKSKNNETYRKFTGYTDGYPLVYLEGYDSLRKFFVEALGWPDDDNHTLPQMKQFRNFVLMCNKDKGMLLAKDICEYIRDDKNNLYNEDVAKRNSFRLLTEETLCPPDLLTHCLKNGMLPDLQMPLSSNNSDTQDNQQINDKINIDNNTTVDSNINVDNNINNDSNINVDNNITIDNADFIARHSLLYYYRGD